MYNRQPKVKIVIAAPNPAYESKGEEESPDTYEEESEPVEPATRASKYRKTHGCKKRMS